MCGPLGSNRGMGDISLSLTKNVLMQDKYEVNFSLGAQIPANHSNAEQVSFLNTLLNT